MSDLNPFMESFSYVCTYAETLVLKAYGLRDLPTAFYPDDKTGGVTLSCYKMHETDSYSNFDDPVMAVNYLVNVTQRIPVHLIFGQKSVFRYALAYYPLLYIWTEDLLLGCRPSEEDLQRLRSSTEQRFASICDIPGAGHLVSDVHPMHKNFIQL